MRIDVHTHYTPPRYFDKMDQLGGFEELGGLKVLGVHRRKHWETRFAKGENAFLEARFESMERAECDRQILSIGAYQPYFSTPAAGVAAAHFINDMYGELSSAHNRRLSTFACLPLPHIDETLAEIDRIYRSKEFVGVTMGCSAQGIPLDNAHFEPVWQELDRRNAVVFLHPGVQMAALPGGGDFHLGPDFGSPAEIAVAVSRLIVCGITTQFPNVRFLIATTGGSLPFLVNRFDHGFKQQNPAEYEQMGGVAHMYRRFWYDTSVIEEPLIMLAARDYFGVDRLMLGSDCPRIEPEHAVSYIKSSPYLTQEEMALILDVNAAEFLGFEGCSCCAHEIHK